MESTIKEDLILRLQYGNLYSLEECKNLLKEILLLCSNKARKDFDELFTIDDYRIKVANQGLIPKNPSIFLPPSVTRPLVASFQNAVLQQTRQSLQPEDYLDENRRPNVSLKLQHTLEELHRNLIRIIELSDAQHQERIMVLRTMVKELENANLLGDKS